jgi:hypothetical protein
MSKPGTIRGRGPSRASPGWTSEGACPYVVRGGNFLLAGFVIWERRGASF